MAQKIGFIGSGNMAYAIVAGILGSGMDAQVLVTDIDMEKCGRFANLGATPVDGSTRLIEMSDILFLSVKPQNFGELLPVIAPLVGDRLIVSIAAGISISYMARALGESAKIVRAMPNTPMLLGTGATVISAGPGVSEGEIGAVKSIFELMGSCDVIPEELINVSIPVGGSAPAYLYLFAKYMCQSAEKEGLPFDLGLKIFANTMIGSAKMLTESGMTPDELIKMVSSPGGTTIAGLESFYDSGLAVTVEKAVSACIRRGEELGGK